MIFDLTLDRPTKWPGAENRIVTAGSQQLLGCRCQFDAHVLVAKTLVKFGQHQINDADDLFLAQLVEDHDVIDPVKEFRAEVLA
ncbi:hypothetical protein GALL_442790 [mine drainage metagenome]|uniref:Uncharacterized protein n=1 Tax=mine drainage metagenome TaxID=410659 RepID=A0A1J5PTC0_9ZZZZ